MSYAIPFDIPTWTYDEALAELHAALRFGIEPLLETVVDMLAELGNPDLAFESVQIAGTNGKTSTSRYAAAILRAEGLRTALYTSPELVRYTERMEINGGPVSDEQFARGIAAARVAGQRVNDNRAKTGLRPYDITEFDLLTVAACVTFAEANVDVAVLEVGMGGRWDATSAIGSIRSVAITGIGLDHMRILGDTLEQIAGEKAAVIQPGRTCVLGVGTATPWSVEDVFLDVARKANVLPTIVRPHDASHDVRPHPELPCVSYRVTRRPSRIGDALRMDVTSPRAVYEGLSASKPAYQAPNVTCAIALCESFLNRALDVQALLPAIATCPTPGRFDVVRNEPLGLVDACHNPQSVEAFLSAVRAVDPSPASRPTLLVAALADKDCASMVSLLAREFPRIVATQTNSPRALPAPSMAKLFRDAGVQVAAICPTVEEALEVLDGTPFVACGSITLAGAVTGYFARGPELRPQI